MKLYSKTKAVFGKLFGKGKPSDAAPMASGAKGGLTGSKGGLASDEEDKLFIATKVSLKDKPDRNL